MIHFDYFSNIAIL